MKRNIVMKIIIIILLHSTLLISLRFPVKASAGEENILTYTVNPEGEAVITGSYGGGREIFIPNVIDGYPVAGIGEEAFRNRTEIEKAVIQQGVRYVGKYAFAGCAGLKEIELGEGLQYIAGNAFCDDVSLSETTLPDSVVYVGENAFGNCTLLARIEHPQTAHIDGYAFEGSLWQEERDEGKFRIRGSLLVKGRKNEDPVVKIPYGITEIDDYRQAGSAALGQHYSGFRYEQVILPDTLIRLGKGCFQGVHIDKIKIPVGVKEIPSYAFEYASLKDIELPRKLKRIGFAAFYGCSYLKEIDIPDTVELIDTNAFGECTELLRITIPGSVHSIGKLAFSQCDSLEEVIFEESVTEIGGDSFDYCDRLERLQLPESLKSMDCWVFCPNMKRIYVPKGTVHINLFDQLIYDYDSLGVSITIYGQKGSRAQEVAEALGMEFVEVENGNEMP